MNYRKEFLVINSAEEELDVLGQLDYLGSVSWLRGEDPLGWLPGSFNGYPYILEFIYLDTYTIELLYNSNFMGFNGSTITFAKVMEPFIVRDKLKEFIGG